MRNKKSGIYRIVNTINDKSYIGSSTNITRRWYEHKLLLKKGSHHSNYLQHSWNKYGEDNFIFEILKECEPNKDILILHEQYFYDKLNPVYNCGKPHLGSLSKETRQKISESLKGHEVKVESRRKGKSGIKGVTWETNRNTWAVYFKYKNKRYSVGRFENLDEAIQARRDAEQMGENIITHKPIIKTGISGIKGVQWDQSRQKWLVQIKDKYIGRFKTIEEATKALKNYSQ